MQISYESSSKWCRNATEAEFSVCKLATNPHINGVEMSPMRSSVYADKLRILF